MFFFIFDLKKQNFFFHHFHVPERSFVTRSVTHTDFLHGFVQPITEYEYDDDVMDSS